MNLSEKIENTEILSEKLVNNFNKSLDRKKDKINKINILSNEIFQKITLEYSGYLK